MRWTNGTHVWPKDPALIHGITISTLKIFVIRELDSFVDRTVLFLGVMGWAVSLVAHGESSELPLRPHTCSVWKAIGLCLQPQQAKKLPVTDFPAVACVCCVSEVGLCWLQQIIDYLNSWHYISVIELQFGWPVCHCIQEHVINAHIRKGM